MKSSYALTGFLYVMIVLESCLCASKKLAIILANVTLTESVPVYCAYCECFEYTDETLSTDCSNKGLKRPPKDLDNRTSELIFKRNLFSWVFYRYFAGLSNLKVLDLSNNRITSFQARAFRDLTNLEELYLNGNNFFLLQVTLQPGIFDGLQSLRILMLHNNIKFTNDSFIRSEVFENLTSLETLTIDGLNNVHFDQAFRKLTHFSTLTMSGITGTCEINSLLKNSLEGLENIIDLTLEHCRIKDIEIATFRSTPNLQYLDLSWNTELKFERFGHIAEDLKHTKMNLLKLSAVHNPYRAGSELVVKDMRHIREINIAELYLDDNGISFIEDGVTSLFPSTLKSLYMRRNKMTFEMYMEKIVLNNPQLEVFDAENQAIAVWSDRTSPDSAYYKDTENERRKKRNVVKYLKLKTLRCSGSRSYLKTMNFTDIENNITYMDLSDNHMPSLPAKAFSGLLILKYLNLSNNFIENVHPQGFKYLMNVKTLDLEGNILGKVLDEDRNGQLFSDLRHLQSLNISKNKIYRIDKNVFRSLHALVHLDLSNNFIEVFDVDLWGLQNLSFIDLSHNRIQSIPLDTRRALADIAKIHNITVDLRMNKFVCNCETIPFLRWLIYSNIHFALVEEYYCSLNNGTIRVFNASNDEFLERLDEECTSYFWIIVVCSTAGSFSLAFVVTYSIYRFRWKLRYLYYMAKIKVDNHNGMNIQDIHFAYDVFVSYGDGDRDFVTHDMLKNLEINGNVRLNIRDRDFAIGELIALNISKAIRSSKKTFLLVSKHFLGSKWCNFEMNMARMESLHMGRKLIVIIFLEAIPPDVFPIEVVRLLKTCPSMDVPKQHLREAFWQKCIEYIRED